MKKKYKVLVVGAANLKSKTTPAGGQEIKVLAYYKHFIEKYGKDNVVIVDTIGWKKHIISSVLSLFKYARKAENIVMLPGSKAIKIIPRLILLFKKKTTKTIILAIGGWLGEKTKKSKRLERTLKKIDFIGVEMNFIKDQLVQLGFNNVDVVRNVRQFKVVLPTEIHKPNDPIKVCTFSRINSVKGIIEAIDAVILANTKLGKAKYELTLYGAVEEPFKEEFYNKLKTCPSYIKYGGVIDTFRSQKILINYDILLFLTRLGGEGFPGTILDAYFSGLMVIGSTHRSLKELVKENVNGYLIENGDSNKTAELLVQLAHRPEEIYQFKLRNLEESKKYSQDKIFNEVDEKLI
jgi:glycosyltransferase involved in cell wall biosynthesis